ncbi:ABC transporter substrate-binding protein [Rhodococcus globerulus]|uniref:ABC transporter substrate-binding protein n=1 Tax=Rhodococcus globerulus TaxID=33008 RepID=A0ABU4C3C1_RHOGO|nr:ABC transporter substrate-binding protein [Rhodococcus globerulus]MDV6271000.1 ABC transporter substrate-binding protein [Rhodococcus globerulus]
MVTLVASLATFASACATPVSTSSPAVVSDQPPEPGGTLRFGVLDAPANLDPQSGSTYPESIITSNIADRLTYQDPESGEIRPWLASSWDYNADLTHFTFQLHEGVTFNDGTAFDAEVVKENFDILGLGDAGLGVPPQAAFWGGYVGTEVLGSNSVGVTFNRPNAGFLQALSHYFSGIVGEKTLALSKTERSRPENIVTTGPFTISEHVFQEKTVLTKRPDYNWPPARSEHTGAAYLDKVEIRVVPEAGVRAGSLQTGDLDAILDVNPTDEQRLASQGFQIVSQLIPGRDLSFDFNTTLAPTNDVAVRRAVNLGWNREALEKTVLSDSYAASTSTISSRVPGYKDFSGSALSFDADHARRILDDAGWKVRGSDGIREKDGQSLTIKLLGVNNLVNNKPSFELVQQDLRKIGIDLQLTLVPIPDFTAQAKTGTYNVQVSSTSRDDPSVIEQAYSPKFSNFANLNPSDPLYNQAVDVLSEISRTLDPTQRTVAVERAQDFVLNTAALTAPIYNNAQVTAASTKVHNITYEAQSRNSFYSLWIAR